MIIHVHKINHDIKYRIKWINSPTKYKLAHWFLERLRVQMKDQMLQEDKQYENHYLPLILSTTLYIINIK